MMVRVGADGYLDTPPDPSKDDLAHLLQRLQVEQASNGVQMRREGVSRSHKVDGSSPKIAYLI